MKFSLVLFVVDNSHRLRFNPRMYDMSLCLASCRNKKKKTENDVECKI